MGHFFKTLLTGADNHSFDIGRVLWALSVLVGMALAAYSVYSGKAFDLQAYGLGVGGLLAGGGLGIKLKENTEPTQGAQVASPNS